MSRVRKYNQNSIQFNGYKYDYIIISNFASLLTEVKLKVIYKIIHVLHLTYSNVRTVLLCSDYAN